MPSGLWAYLLRMSPMIPPKTDPFFSTFPGLLWILSFSFVFLGLGLSQSAFNLQAMLFLNDAGRDFEPVWSCLTQLGDGAVALLLLLVLTRWAAHGHSLALKAFLLGSFVSPILKKIFAHPRPLSVLDPSQLNVIGLPVSSPNAMPSGHSLTVVTCMLLLMLSLPKTHRFTPLGSLVLGMLAVLSALSRVMVGAHWPSDVLAGAGFGGLVVWLALQWEQRQPWQRHLSTRTGQICLLLGMLFLIIYLLNAATHTIYERWMNDLVATLGIAGFLVHWRDIRHRGVT
jgi:membrane-associated phospholipid phosphatase